MIGFIAGFVLAFGSGLLYLVRRKRAGIEMSLYASLSLIGFLVWMSILLHRHINPNQWIAWLIDRVGL